MFCDLWQYTADAPTPPGAIPAQMRIALDEAFPKVGGTSVLEAGGTFCLKLYNASNFFDDKAIPPEDDAETLRLTRPFSRLVVECHPKMVRRRCFDFAARFEGRLLVAMGLETVHPEAQPRLGKGASLADFARAADARRQHGIGLRAFVLVGAPFVPAAEAVDWTVHSAAYAFEHGAEQVALIPVRGGNGEMERLAAEGDFTPPTLGQLEEALDRCRELEAPSRVVAADLWDLERFSRCAVCLEPRRERLERLGFGGPSEPLIHCEACAP